MPPSLKGTIKKAEKGISRYIPNLTYLEKKLNLRKHPTTRGWLFVFGEYSIWCIHDHPCTAFWGYWVAKMPLNSNRDQVCRSLERKTKYVVVYLGIGLYCKLVMTGYSHLGIFVNCYPSWEFLLIHLFDGKGYSKVLRIVHVDLPKRR